jgi:hypothetical protein
MQNVTVVSSTNTALENGVPAFLLSGANMTGVQVVRGNNTSPACLMELYLGIVADSQGTIPYNEYGPIQTWGYNAAVTKVSATDADGDALIVATDTAVAVTGIEAAATHILGQMAGTLLDTVSATVGRAWLHHK